MQDFLGNALADAGAGVAAEEAVDFLVAREAGLWQERAFLIARRLAIIEASMWSDAARLVPAPEPLVRWEPPSVASAVSAFDESINAMGHKLHRTADFLRCSRCRRRRKLAAHKFWTNSRCVGMSCAEFTLALMQSKGVLRELEEMEDKVEQVEQEEQVEQVERESLRGLLPGAGVFTPEELFSHRPHKSCN